MADDGGSGVEVGGRGRRAFGRDGEAGSGGRRRFRCSGSAALLFKGLASTGEGVAFFVDKALDFKDQFDFATAIEALAGAAFVGFELGELRFPKAQDVGLKATDFRDIANLEIKAIRDCRRFRCAFARTLRGHFALGEGQRKPG